MSVTRKFQPTGNAVIEFTDSDLYLLCEVLERLRTSNIPINSEKQEFIEDLLKDIESLYMMEQKVKACKHCAKVKAGR
jgi:predicted DNA-binding protein